MKYFALIVLFTFSLNAAPNSIDSVKARIETYISAKKAKVGVAYYNFSTKESLSINDNHKYPMQSVYKFPLALAVLDKVDRGELALNQLLKIKKSDLLDNTWSPLREKYPNGNVELPLSEIIRYTVAESDNNACDILFRLISGTKYADNYLISKGITNIAIRNTEEEMHKDWAVQYDNWAYPSEMLKLLKMFYEKILLSDSTHKFLWQTMVETYTGKNRIKGLLPKGTIVAHKTGSSGANKAKLFAATNDVGIVVLPSGNAFALVVFVSDSNESDADNERIIAEVSKMLWEEAIK